MGFPATSVLGIGHQYISYYMALLSSTGLMVTSKGAISSEPGGVITCLVGKIVIRDIRDHLSIAAQAMQWFRELMEANGNVSKETAVLQTNDTFVSCGCSRDQRRRSTAWVHAVGYYCTQLMNDACQVSESP
jgi:hypothetical protein